VLQVVLDWLQDTLDGSDCSSAHAVWEGLAVEQQHRKRDDDHWRG